MIIIDVLRQAVFHMIHMLKKLHMWRKQSLFRKEGSEFQIYKHDQKKEDITANFITSLIHQNVGDVTCVMP